MVRQGSGSICITSYIFHCSRINILISCVARGLGVSCEVKGDIPLSILSHLPVVRLGLTLGSLSCWGTLSSSKHRSNLARSVAEIGGYSNSRRCARSGLSCLSGRNTGKVHGTRLGLKLNLGLELLLLWLLFTGTLLQHVLLIGLLVPIRGLSRIIELLRLLGSEIISSGTKDAVAICMRLGAAAMRTKSAILGEVVDSFSTITISSIIPSIITTSSTIGPVPIIGVPAGLSGM